MFLVFGIWSSTDSKKIRNYLSNLLYMNIEYFLEIRKTEEIPPFIPPSLLRMGENIICIAMEGIFW